MDEILFLYCKIPTSRGPRGNHELCLQGDFRSVNILVGFDAKDKLKKERFALFFGIDATWSISHTIHFSL